MKRGYFMKKNPIIRFFTLAACLCIGVFSFGAPSALTVLTASPKGPQRYFTNQAVSIHFNQPVVALGEEEEFSSGNCPITITPSVEGSCRYSGTQTLIFEPKDNWPKATKFTVTLKKGFTSAVSQQELAQDYTFSFTSDTPTVYSMYPYNNERWISLTPTIYAYFSLPIDAEKVAPFIRLEESSGKQTKMIPLSVSEVKEEMLKSLPSSYGGIKKVVAIYPQKKLEIGKKYTVVFEKGLPSTEGPLGMAKEDKYTFFTYPKLFVRDSQTSGCLPFSPTVTFSSPVRMRSIFYAAEVTPASAKRDLSEQELNSLGYESYDSDTKDYSFRTALSFINVKPNQSVTVTLKAGMTDIFGNKLPKDETFTVTNNGYCPSMEFSGGKGVLESYLNYFLPIEVMNMPKVNLRGKVFSKEDYIPFEKQDRFYCKAAKLTGDFFSQEYSFKFPENQAHRTGIDLKVFNPTAKNSIVFSQIQNPNKENSCWTYSVTNITDVGITLKGSPQNTLVWVTSLKTGEPLPNKKVELRDKENNVLWTGITDENGIARAPGWNELGLRWSWFSPTLYAFVESEGGNGVISSEWKDGMEPWRFHLSYDYDPQEHFKKIFLFTDRGIYRPGETVYVKGIARTRENGRWQTGQFVNGKLTIYDSRAEEVLSKDITLSDMGTFDVSFPISSTAYTGAWSAEFIPNKLKGEEEPTSYTTAFRVEAVKAAEFDVHLRSLKDNYFANENVAFTVSANYQFGGVLAGAPAKWKVRKSSSYFEPKNYKDYTFTPYFLREEDEEDDDNLILSSSGVLDDKGTAAFQVKAPTESYPVSLYAEADVQSPSRQDLFSRTSVTVHPAGFYIGVQRTTENPEVGQPVEIDLIAVTPDGKAVPASVTAEIYRRQWNSVRKVGLSGRLEWVNFSQTFDIDTQTIPVGKDGGTLKFTPKMPGNYIIKLKSTDKAGRTVRGGTNFYVYGKGEVYWEKTDDDLLELEPNQKEYNPGQTARIAVKSPYEKAKALVTVEREGILDAWVTEVEGGGSYVSVPLKENYLPNVYVNVMLVQGRTDKPITDKLDLGKPQIKYGYARLSVVPNGKKITATITPNAQKYQPRQQVTLDISTKIQGKAVPAEVTVMAVDEGILALTKYQTPNLFDYFYGPMPISVFTADNRAYLIGQRSFGEKGENRGGDGGAKMLMGGTDLRSKFLFTPYFQGSVKTDKKGKARVTFTLPDNLTTFRLMAVAATQDSFGSAENSIRVSKPIMVTSNVPQFARKADAFKCGAVVHNHEDKKGVITVKIQTKGPISADGNAEQTVTVPLGKSQEVTWNCHAENEGEAEVAFEAKGKEYKDGVIQKINVSTVEKQQKLAVYSATKKEEKQLLKRPTNLNLSADNQVRLSMASTALLNLRGAAWYLMTYPYDCVEQQMSKVLPVILNEKLMETFGLGTIAENRKKVEEVLGNLPSYQDGAGGFGYWKGSLPDPYVTAYVLEVGYMAKQLNYKVPETSYKKAAEWLNRAFSNSVRRAYSYSLSETDTMKAYMTYVLALYGKDTHGMFNTLYAKRTTLPVSAVSYLLKAAVTLKESDSVKKELAQRLFNHMVYNPSSSYIDVTNGSYWLHTDNVSATALALDALVTSNQTADHGYQMATWLTSQMNHEGHWRSTSSNAAVLRALLTYYEAEESTNPNFDGTISIGSKKVFSHHFEGINTKEEVLSLPMNEVYGTSKEVRVTAAKKGDGMLYYTLAQLYEPAAFDKPVSSGFQVSRTVTTLDDKPVDTFRAGERYKVTLKITTNAARTFVVAEDFIPAGFEIVNTSLATETSYENKNNYNSFERSEKYTDRIAAFADYLPSGTHTYSYVVAAVTAGQYSYPSAWVSQMYEPEVFGRTATDRAVINP